MNLVAEVMEMSAPSSSGFWNTGVMMELSTHTSAPTACASLLMAAMSVICMRGLVGLSSITCVVEPRRAAIE
jgi:hypothetical protein